MLAASAHSVHVQQVTFEVCHQARSQLDMFPLLTIAAEQMTAAFPAWDSWLRFKSKP